MRVPHKQQNQYPNQPPEESSTHNERYNEYCMFCCFIAQIRLLHLMLEPFILAGVILRFYDTDIELMFIVIFMNKDVDNRFIQITSNTSDVD